MAPLAGNKRKIDYTAPGTPAQARKRQKGRDARTIPTQTADPALSKAGELDIAAFVKAREFEIAALQQSMKRSRKSLTQRAFQQVPRHMRRRTASHNVKKIPRRMRGRALREIKEDNTPTGSARKKKLSSKLRLRLETAKRLQKLNARRKSVRQRKKEAKANAREADPAKHRDAVRVPRIKKNKLAVPPQATSKFKRRQVNKTWLPTHLWHTKRAHLTRPTLPLWRMAIPLRPTEKSYRPTHRALGSRGCIAWDTSYISTIGCQGTEATLEGMLKAIGFHAEGWSGSKYKRWKAGTRHAEGWVFHGQKKDGLVAPVSILWQVESNATDPTEHHPTTRDAGGVQAEKQQKRIKLDRRLLVRVHPSAFPQSWTEILSAAKGQKPQVLIEDLRFEIGSITVQGPQSTEALAAVLKLTDHQPHLTTTWPSLATINNPAALPLNVVLAMNVTDPRLRHPPRKLVLREDDQTRNELSQTIVSWPLDGKLLSSSLFEHKTRYRVTKSLPSQKAINRRRTGLLPGQEIQSTEKDPRIPVILTAHRPPERESKMQGYWTLLLPWGCVDLVWRSLMYCPLSTGSTPRFGGLGQTQQVAFEQSMPWFPGDFPGTDSGKAWDRTESEIRFDKWMRRPPSKRYAWEAVDLGLGRKGELGRGWACDWEYLFQETSVTTGRTHQHDSPLPRDTLKTSQPRLLTQRQRKSAATQEAKAKEQDARRRNTSSPESDDEHEEVHNDVKYGQLPLSKAVSLEKTYQTLTLSNEPLLATVRIKFLTRGTPSPAARIYRLPLAGVSSEGNPIETRSSEQQKSGPDLSGVSPILFTDDATRTAINVTTLRKQWLDLDPNPIGQLNPSCSTSLLKQLGKDRRNHSGDPVAHTVYDKKHTRDLSHIRVFPPREKKPEVLNMFGPRPPPKTEEELRKVYQPQLVPKKLIDARGGPVLETLWEKHVPCPGSEDLVGFVTTGGYNLVEGAGTAVGAIWMQKLFAGWKNEDTLASSETQVSGDSSVGSDQHQSDIKKTSKRFEDQSVAKAQKRRQQSANRERHLCIVRNAGESIGRLAVWEFC